MVRLNRKALTEWLPNADWELDSGDEVVTVPEILRAYSHLPNPREHLLNALMIGAIRAIALKAYVIVAQHNQTDTDYDERIKNEDTILRNSYMRGNRGILHQTTNIDSWFWSEHMMNSDGNWFVGDDFFVSAYQCDWNTGTFTKAVSSFQSDSEGYEDTWLVRLYGVRLSKKDIEIVFAGETPPFATKVLDREDGVQSRTGGRRAAKHGEPIAKVTLRLSKLPPSELSKYTADSLALELRRQYLEEGETPPGEQSCRQFAQGILRALRN